MLFWDRYHALAITVSVIPNNRMINSLFEIVVGIALPASHAVEDEVTRAFETAHLVCAQWGIAARRTKLNGGSDSQLARSFTPLFCVIGDVADTVPNVASARVIRSILDHMCASAATAHRVYVYVLEADHAIEKPATDTASHLRRILHRVSVTRCVIRRGIDSLATLGDLLRADVQEALDLHLEHLGRTNRNDALHRLHGTIAQGYRKGYLRVGETFERLDELLLEAASPVMVSGLRREGKSALLANWIAHLLSAHPAPVVLQHFVEANSEGSGHASVLQHLVNELQEMRYLAPDNGTVIALEDAFRVWACAPSTVRVVVVIDGVDQLDEAGRSLRWLPQHLGKGVSIVVSAAPGDALDAARDRGWPELRFKVPDRLRSEIAARIMRRDELAIVDGGTTPDTERVNLHLLEARAFLRAERPDDGVSGDDQAETSDAVVYDPMGLVDVAGSDISLDVARYVLDQLADIPTVPDLLGLLWASRSGLDADDVVALLGVSSSEVEQLLERVGHLTVRRAGLIRPCSSLVRDALGHWLLRRGVEPMHIHATLAGYFTAHADTARRACEAPWQWHRAGDKRALRDCIASLAMFIDIIDEGREHELLGYWKEVGTYREAGVAYGRAVDILCADLLNTSADLARGIRTLERLGSFLGSCGVYDMAGRFLEQAVELREARLRGAGTMEGELRGGDLDIARARGQLGEMLRRAGRYAQAIDVLKRAYLALDANPNRNEATLAQVANDLGLALHEANRSEEGFDPSALLRRALELKERLFGREHRSTAETLSDMALLYQREETARVSISLCEQALRCVGWDRIGTVYDEPSENALIDYNAVSGEVLDAATFLTNLAGARRKTKHPVTALVLFHRVLEIRELLLRSEHPHVLVARNNLAACLVRSNDVDGAYAICRSALADATTALNDDHPHMLAATITLAGVIRELARRLMIDAKPEGERGSGAVTILLGEARDLLTVTLGACRRALPSGHPTTAGCLDSLAATLYDLGDNVGAVNRYEQAVQELYGADIRDDRRIALILVRQAAALRARNHDREAVDPLSRAMVIYDDLVDHQHPASLNALYALAVLLDDLDDPGACATLRSYLDRHPDHSREKPHDAIGRLQRRGCGGEAEKPLKASPPTSGW